MHRRGSSSDAVAGEPIKVDKCVRPTATCLTPPARLRLHARPAGRAFRTRSSRSNRSTASAQPCAKFPQAGRQDLGDLLEYFPRDYQFESSELSIRELRNEQIQTARGEIVAVDYMAGGVRRGRFEATIQDASATSSR